MQLRSRVRLTRLGNQRLNSAAWQRAVQRARSHREEGEVRYALRRGTKLPTWDIASATEPSRTYEVVIHSLANMHATCTCDYGRSGRDGFCWHVALILNVEAQRRSEWIAQ